MHIFKMEDIPKDIEYFKNNVDTGWLFGFPEIEMGEESNYLNVIIPQLMYENLEAYNYLPDYMQTSEFIMRAYWDIMSNRTTCDEERNWLEWIIEDHIDDAFFEKDSTEIKEEEEALKYLTYIPDEVETGIVKTR